MLRRLFAICVLLVAAEAHAAILELTSGSIPSSGLLNQSFGRFEEPGFSIQGANVDLQTFAANPPMPTLTRLSQWSSGGELEITETLTGTNFVSGATAVEVRGTTGITVVSEVVTSNSVKATFRVARDVKPGTYLVTVTTAGGTSAQPFIVQPNGSSISTIVGPQGKKVKQQKKVKPAR